MTQTADEFDIAVIAIAARFPGARDVDEFWRNLRAGTESIRALNAEQLRVAGVDDATSSDPSYVRAASTLDGVELFDASFFGYSPREASLLDPQARVFLECAWTALESAGYNPQRTGVSVGLYAAQSMSTYLLAHLHAGLALRDFTLAGGNIHTIVGNGSDFLPTRVSYKLNLGGPSVNVQSACSSSLVAVHLARQALLAGECDMALAGGVSIYLPQSVGYIFEEGMILSPDGRCRPFDAEARGTIFGRGAGVVVLKRMADALRDGDDVYAVIKGSAVNNDGAAKVGYTAPGIDGQARVVAEALANAGLDGGSISYIEAHGTGTPQGDPIEIAALTRAFRETNARKQHCAIGSVKANIGHLDVAAGIAGLIKTVLMLRHRERPASLNFTRPNPQIDFAGSPFYVNSRLDAWPADAPRRAGVSSFGMGGTNAHVVLEEAPPAAIEPVAHDRPVHLLTLSAKTESALAELTARASTWFGKQSDDRMQAACFTSNVGRAHFRHRLALPVRTAADAAASLAAAAQVPARPVAPNGERRIVFLFTGQGSQYSGMGRELYESEPLFRSVVDRCAALLKSELDVPLTSVMFDPQHAELLRQTRYTQPALFALEYALVELWSAWGIAPDLVLGHSLGEDVAACAAGVFSLDDGLRLIAARARLMQALPQTGEMAVVFAPQSRVRSFVDRAPKTVAIAAVNGPQNVVISGERSAVRSIVAELARDGVESQALSVSHAFHSPLIEPMLDAFETIARGIRYAPAKIPVVSNVTAQRADDRLLSDPAYWRRHVREPVRFADSIATIAVTPRDLLIEIGPTPTLTVLGKGCTSEPALWLASLRKGRSDSEQMLETLGALYGAGVEPAWEAFHRGRPRRRRLAMPTYPFARERHWIEPSAANAPGAAPAAGRRLIARQISSPALSERVFEAIVSPRNLPYVADHRVGDAVVFPATGFLELAFEAAALAGLGDTALEKVSIGQALVCTEEEIAVQIMLAPAAHDRTPFRIFARPHAAGADVEWSLHANGDLVAVPLAQDSGAFDIDAARARCTAVLGGAEYYAALAERGFCYGPAFQGIHAIRWRDGEAVADVAVPAAIDTLGDHHAHPAVFDAGLQAALAAAGQLDMRDGRVQVPTSFDRVTVSGSVANVASSHARVQRRDGLSASVDVELYDAAGRRIISARGVRIVTVPLAALAGRAKATAADRLYEIRWPAKDLPPIRSPGARADFLPAVAELARGLGAHVSAACARHRIDVYESLRPELDALCTEYVLAALSTLGWTPAVGERTTTVALARRTGVTARYERMLERSLEMLAEDGFLGAEPDGWRVLRTLTPPSSPDTRARRLLEEYPACGAELVLTSRCGAQLADVLTERVDPLQLLFPGGETADLERLYRDAPFTRAYNEIARDTVEAALRTLPADRKIRILEIGAGTGGTSSTVLPVLPPERTEYVFTDASNLFMVRAKARFAEFPFIDYRLLDIERDPSEQGYAAADFDLVLATNVLHATSDLRRTAQFVRRLLAPGGMLVMVEGIARQRWVDLIFGLTDGWWKATDAELRGTYPLISRQRWQEVLLADGFAEATSIPSEPAQPIFDQAVLLARTQLAGAAQRTPRERLERRVSAYVVVGDVAELGGAVAAQLESAGSVRVISPHRERSAPRDGLATADFADAAAMQSALAAALDSELPCRAVVFCAGDRGDPASVGALRTHLAQHCGGLLHAVQAVARRGGDSPKLYVVTRGVQALENSRPQPADAALWGLRRVVALEHPELDCVSVDLDPAESDEIGAKRIAAELGARDGETEIVWRAGKRHVARLVPLPKEPQLDARDDSPVTLGIAERGTLDRLEFRPANRSAPERDEVEIRVHAAGLNLKDVLNTLGTYPGDPGPIGLECAGTVSALGANVRGLAVGDKVVAIAPGCFGTYARARASLVVPMPAGLSFEQGATIPAAFTTAQHALRRLAKLQAGERVLIHAAAGGVGMAAVQIALRAGAQVFATAGSADKRAFVRGLGVEHVFDSRSLEFAEEVLRGTAGRGVDVVLNSLAGEFIDRSFAALARGGRFIELGKSGIWPASRVRELGREIVYHVVDVQADTAANDATVSAALREVVELVRTGELSPLPVTPFGLASAADAFRYMAQAKHIGKIVLTVAPEAGSELVRADASYLITGGFGGLGTLFAHWLADRGARALVLLGRRAPDAAARAAIAALSARGVEVAAIIGDVAEPADVARSLAAAPAHRPLRGVIHAAGALDDGALAQQTVARFEHVLHAKVYGAWNLDRATEGRPLDWFVMFSSLAAILGSRGQANHAAANAFMDALAAARRARGLAGLSLNWGAWSEIGAAAQPDLLQRLRGIGIGALAPQEALELFETVLRRSAARPATAPAQVGVLAVDWPRYVREACADRVPPLLAELATARPAVAAALAPAARPAEAPLLDRLTSARPAARKELLTTYLREHVVRSLGLDPQRPFDLKQPLSELGLDSLMAVELRTRIARGLGSSRSLPATLLFDYPTVEQIADYLRAELLPDEGKSAAAPRTDAAWSAVVDLTDEQAEAMLAAELEARPGTVV